MSMSIGSGQLTLQFNQQTSALSKQIVQAQLDNAQQQADSVVRRSGKESVKNQQNIVNALSLQNRRGQAIDVMV